MVKSKVWFFIAGMVERSDSIAYDLICQQQFLTEMYPNISTTIVAKDINRQYYPQKLLSWDEYMSQGARPGVNDVVIYHYCDGWEDFENHAEEELTESKLIMRWHNNTPPWFFIGKREWVLRTLDGFDRISSAVSKKRWTFATNSEFTIRQLSMISKNDFQASVVYPASLNLNTKTVISKPVFSEKFLRKERINLLFVGRVVPHKSHALMINFARACQERLKVSVYVHIVGRHSDKEYIKNIIIHAEENGVELIMHGEVSDEELGELYLQCDVFTCFSQHEGFGLPVYEAMKYQKPIICTLTSAFAELLYDHPMCNALFDVEFYVTEVDRFIRDENFRSRVLLKQKEILSRYTVDVIKGQLLDLLEAPKRIESISKINLPALSVFNRSFDAEKQLYSLDDRVLFRKFLDMVREEEAKRQTFDFRQKYVYFEGQKFSAMQPLERVNESGALLRINRSVHFDECLIFGPYVKLKKGIYRVTFSLGIESDVDKNFKIDVFSFRPGGLTEKVININKGYGREQFYDMYFEVGDDLVDENIEFRIRAASSWHDEFSLLVNWVGVMRLDKI